MPATSEQRRASRGLSVRQLTLIFFGLVAVCAIFFALGFVVGSNRPSNNAAPATEHVSMPSEVPPTVNPPPDGSSASASNAQTSSVIEQDLKPATPPPSSAASASRARALRAARPPGNGSAAPSAAPPAGILVQVAATHTQQDAQSLVQALKARGYTAFLVMPQAGAEDQIYRVQVGPFASHSQAMRTLHRLSREGFKPFIRE